MDGAQSDGKAHFGCGSIRDVDQRVENRADRYHVRGNVRRKGGKKGPGNQRAGPLTRHNPDFRMSVIVDDARDVGGAGVCESCDRLVSLPEPGFRSAADPAEAVAALRANPVVHLAACGLRMIRLHYPMLEASPVASSETDPGPSSAQASLVSGTSPAGMTGGPTGSNKSRKFGVLIDSHWYDLA